MKKSLMSLTALVLSLVMAVSAIIIVRGETEKDSEIVSVNSENITRGEFLKLVCNAFEVNAVEKIEYEFTDIEKDSEHYDYIIRALNAGIITGYSDNTVRAGESILYEEAIAILLRTIGEGNFKAFPYDYIAFSIEHGISDGVFAFIGEKITHDEATRLINNALNYVAENNSGTVLHNTAMSGGGGSSWSKSGAVMMYDYAGRDAADGMIPMEEWEKDGGYYYNFNTEEYASEEENVFKNTVTSPLSTFSIDTDTASYSNMRRFILNGQDIPSGAIRSEELINYFTYKKAQIADDEVFGINYTVGECPWNSENKLAMITLNGEELTERKPSNLVFLIDVSGSMYSYNKLPMVKKALSMLLDTLDEQDTISIVTYASGTRVALDVTPATEKEIILNTISSLSAGGSTAGASGIELAYKQAEKGRVDGNNRIILCTDGDFNVGVYKTNKLEELIAEKRESGIYLSVLGFGMGNYKDAKMEALADNGNGNYAYIDNLKEAKKVLVDEMPKTIYTIADDVKIQVEFNPATVKSYRLIGYENRLLNNEDFENDKKDAGELGAGATVTVLYEIVPNSEVVKSELKYSQISATGNNELCTVSIRYKFPGEESSKLIEMPVNDTENLQLSSDFSFAAAIAEFGMIINNSEYKGTSSLDNVINLATEGIDDDRFGLRYEFVQLVDLYRYSH